MRSEGGGGFRKQRRKTRRRLLGGTSSSSTANAVPLPPLGKAVVVCRMGNFIGLFFVEGHPSGSLRQASPATFSLRLGHARVLTPPRGVIHCARAASLPPGGRPYERGEGDFMRKGWTTDGRPYGR